MSEKDRVHFFGNTAVMDSNCEKCGMPLFLSEMRYKVCSHCIRKEQLGLE